MNPIIVVNLFADAELDPVQKLADRFGDSLRVVTDRDITFAQVWQFPTMDKRTVDWTRRFLDRFTQEQDFDCLIKLDPDTELRSPDLPLPPNTCDVAGDFRQSNAGWIWFGAYQFFTKSAVQEILQDTAYTGNCVYQDIALAASVVRLGKIAYNMPEVDGWCMGKTDAVVVHEGRSRIGRQPAGIVRFK